MIKPTSAGFLFSDVVGLDDAKLALQLVAVDPLIGGVLLRGEKGSAKTTLARGLSALLGDGLPFVDLPLGVTEDRLIGTLDLAKALAGEQNTVSPGLLARAHGGVLYIDEVNLLADHLVDTLLDVAVSGVNRIERETVSHEHPARFVLIGSMNPEEGELRPQLLDRFGLSVDVVASTKLAERIEAVRRRLSYEGMTIDGFPAEFESSETMHGVAEPRLSNEQLQDRLASAKPAALPSTIFEQASALALAVGAEGLRADLVLCRAAAANAGLGGRSTTTEQDLRQVAPLVLAHRSRRNPFDPATIPAEQLNDVVDSVLGQDSEPDAGSGSSTRNYDNSETQPQDVAKGGGPSGQGNGFQQRPMATGDDFRSPNLQVASVIKPIGGGVGGKRKEVESIRGRVVRDVPAIAGSGRPVAVAATVRHLAVRRSADPEAVIEPADIQESVRHDRTGSLLILVVDTSGSMGAEARADLAIGTALGLLVDAYENRDQVAMVTFGGLGAKTVLTPTSSVEVARNRLQGLQTGGATPLAAGIHEAISIAGRNRDKTRSPLIIMLTDGRATEAMDHGDPVEDAMAAAAIVSQLGLDALVLDCETGTPRLGLANRLAAAMSAPALGMSDLMPRSAEVDAIGSAGLAGSNIDRLTSLIRSRIVGS